MGPWDRRAHRRHVPHGLCDQAAYLRYDSGDDDLEALVDASASVGFPVLENDRAIAAVGIRLPALRMRGDNRDRVLAAGLRTAREIQSRLG